MHNINLKKIQESIEQAKIDPSAVQVKLNLQGVWRTDESLPQFGGIVQLPSGTEVILESDFPPFLGGQGRKPSPLQYCFWGGMACYASTFAIVAANENIEIKSMTIKTTGTIDFNQALGLSNAAPIQGLTWEITVETSASAEKLVELNKLAEERCPASWMMKNIVPFKAKVTKMNIR